MHHIVGQAMLAEGAGCRCRVRDGWLRLDGARGEGQLVQGPSESRSHSTAWASVTSRQACIAGGGLVSVSTDSEQECLPSLVQGNEGHSRYASVWPSQRLARELQHRQTAGERGQQGGQTAVRKPLALRSCNVSTLSRPIRLFPLLGSRHLSFL